jgi:hypothetical protein
MKYYSMKCVKKATVIEEEKRVKKQLSVSMKEEREEEPAMQSEMCREI